MLRLPEDSLARTTPDMRRRLAQDKAWSNETELLAQVVEMISVVASERRLPKPLDIPRPSWVKSTSQPPGGGGSSGGRNPYSDAITRMRAAGPARRRA